MTVAALLLGAALAASPQAAFDAGVDATRAGEHAVAVDLFLDALDAGGRDPAVYHGLGNALWRLGETGPAIAAWRRGARLAPRDADIAANLDRARRATRDRLDPPVPGFRGFFWQEALAPRESALGASLAAFLALAALLARAIRRRGAPTTPRWGWETPLGLLVAALLATSTAATVTAGTGAVVAVDQVSARSTPSPDGVELFVLHEGAEVALREVDGDRALVALPDDRRGWLPASALLSTDPRAPFPRPDAD